MGFTGFGNLKFTTRKRFSFANELNFPSIEKSFPFVKVFSLNGKVFSTNEKLFSPTEKLFSPTKKLFIRYGKACFLIGKLNFSNFLLGSPQTVVKNGESIKPRASVQGTFLFPNKSRVRTLSVHTFTCYLCVFLKQFCRVEIHIVTKLSFLNNIKVLEILSENKICVELLFI